MRSLRIAPFDRGAKRRPDSSEVKRPCAGIGGELPLPLRERVGVRGSGLSIDLNPSPGSHLTMRHSRSIASAFSSKDGRQRRPLLSRKGRGEERRARHRPYRIQIFNSQGASVVRLSLRADPDTPSHSRDAMRPRFARNRRPGNERAWGMPDARCTRSLVCAYW